MIDELNSLRKKGIKVNISSGEIDVYFCTASFLGDNLALNTILGFQESFSSNSFCRICKSLRNETQYATTENVNKIRNRENYKTDLETNYPYLTGIKSNSVLNKIESFHVTENFAVDIAHDIFEGVGGVVMANLLYQFILVDKYFDLETLNNRIKFFNFNINHNKPPLISVESLKKKTLKMSASEMKSFILNSGLIFGHLIPKGNKFWQIYILLRQILSIILKRYVTSSMIQNLKELIHNHHSLYISLFGQHLKPKFHFLTHYSTILKTCGPLPNLSTLRYESKNRQFKIFANVIASRVNIDKSLAIKHQLQLASRFASQKGFNDNVVYTSCHEYSDISEVLSQYNLQSNEILKREQYPKCQSMVVTTKNIKVNSKVYRIGDYICVDFEKNSSFGKILDIVVNKDNTVLLIFEYLTTVNFDEHFFAFLLNESNRRNCILFEQLIFFDTFQLVFINNFSFLSME